MQILTQPLNLFIMQIDTENKGKEVVDKGKDVVPPSEVMPI